LANPNFVPNRNFKRDMFNILVGMVWQITLMAAPVFLVLREYSSLIISVVIMIVTSAILKYTWWDKLSEMDEEVAAEIKPVLEQEPA
jgi:SSS family solute:Na+ symporter